MEDGHPAVSGLLSSRFVGPTERELHLVATRVSPGEWGKLQNFWGLADLSHAYIMPLVVTVTGMLHFPEK